MVVITVPKVLREKLGEDGTDSLVELINQSEVKSKEDVLKFIEEKFEKRLTLEASQINERIATEASQINERITTEVSKINERIATEALQINERIITEVSKINERITTEVSKINERITTEISKVNNNISEAKSEIIKWMFIFWAGQIGVLIGLLFAFFKR